MIFSDFLLAVLEPISLDGFSLVISEPILNLDLIDEILLMSLFIFHDLCAMLIILSGF